MWPFTNEDRRHPWTAPPARPIRYALGARLVDLCCGYRDGKRGLPHIPDSSAGQAAPAQVGTPRLEELRRMARDRMEGERQSAERDCATVASRLAGARQRVESALAREEDLSRQAEQANRPLSEHELAVRRLAEARHPDVLVRARRGAEHERRRLGAGTDHAAAVREVSDARRLVAELEETIERRDAAVRIRARRLHEHAWRRVAAYWQQLVRSHSQGAVLNEQIRPAGPDLPDWAREPAQPLLPEIK